MALRAVRPDPSPRPRCRRRRGDTSSSMSSVSSSTGTPRSSRTPPHAHATQPRAHRCGRPGHRRSVLMIRTTPADIAQNPIPTRWASHAVHCHFQTQQVIDGLPAQDERGPPSRTDTTAGRQQVVPARHRVAVGAGGGHGQQVTGDHIVGHPGVADDDIATLAVLPDNCGPARLGVADPATPGATSYSAP